MLNLHNLPQKRVREEEQEEGEVGGREGVREGENRNERGGKSQRDALCGHV